MDKLRAVTQKLFSKYLLVTNTVVYGGLLAAGDGVIQNIEYLHRKRQKMSSGDDKHKESESMQFDWVRTRRMACVGAMLAPFNHVWYNIVIEKLVKGHGKKMVFKKILCDQAVAAPFFCSSFFIAYGAMEGREFAASVAEVKEKFIMVYLVDWCFWPPAQFVNFYFVPLQFRVLYVAFLTLCWNCFLSWIKHKDQHKSHEIKDS